MCKVVEDPAAVLPVMSLLEPLVKSAVEQISDPEARSVAERAYKTLKKSAEGSENKVVSAVEAAATIKAAVGSEESVEVTLDYVSAFAAMATNMQAFNANSWKSGVGYTAPFSGVIEDVRAKMEVASKPAEEIEDEDDGAWTCTRETFLWLTARSRCCGTQRCT